MIHPENWVCLIPKKKNVSFDCHCEFIRVRFNFPCFCTSPDSSVSLKFIVLQFCVLCQSHASKNMEHLEHY